MSDREIVEAILRRDPKVTRWFFFEKCRPLFLSILKNVFDGKVDYDAMVNELYLYILADDGSKLRKFEYRSSIYQWIKVVAIRLFLRKRDEMASKDTDDIDDRARGEVIDTPQIIAQRIDVANLLSMMKNARYAFVLRRLIMEEDNSETVAAELGVTIDNLYNIKRRAIVSLTKIALKYYDDERRPR